MSNVSFDISEIIDDPDWNQDFEITRVSQTVSSQGRAVNIEESINMNGVIYPSTSQELERFPEADRVEAHITIYSKEALTSGANGLKPDLVKWQDELWRVIKCEAWKDYGYYQSIAINTTMTGIAVSSIGGSDE